jgi:capsular exopolysaccharide synthesis family protein
MVACQEGRTRARRQEGPTHEKAVNTVSGGSTPAGSVELRDYLTVFKRQFVLILAVVVLGGVAAGAYSFRRTPLYESTASVLVRAITTNAFDPGQRVDQQLNMFNQRQLALSEPVAAVAAKQLGTTATPQQLIKHIAADVPANSQIVRIHYRDTVPLSAQRGADAFAKAYLAFREAEARTQAASSQKTLQKDIARLQQELTRAEAIVANATATQEAVRAAQARITSLNNRLQPLVVQVQGFQSLDFTPGTVIAAADLPNSPVSPKHRLDVGIGLLVGLFLGVVLAFVRDHTDDRLRGREDLAERLERPVLATIPPLSRWMRRGRIRWRRRPRSSLVTLDQPNTPAAESYRTLRTRMARLASQLDINSVMVVSAEVGEGKSTTAANLAVVLAETGKDVLLVSADLRRPRVHQFFGLPNRSGLSDVLADGTAPARRPGAVVTPAQKASELWSVAPNLWVILSGPLPPHPSALMDSDAMRQFLKEQRDLFDFIILDCPPALVVADAMALAPLADAVLVVADAKESDREAVSRLREELDQVGGRIVGAVLNRSKQAAKSSYYYDPQDH